jgi:hypothetical protein
VTPKRSSRAGVAAVRHSVTCATAPPSATIAATRLAACVSDWHDIVNIIDMLMSRVCYANDVVTWCVQSARPRPSRVPVASVLPSQRAVT